MKSRHLIVSNLKKIIPINENLSQFSAHVSVLSDNEPFKAAIVSQTRLEEKGEIEYQDAVNGFIEYNVSQENNVRQTFFLVLVANTNVEVEVSLDIQALTKAPKTSRPPAPKHQGGGGTNWVLIGIMLLAVAGAAWYFFVYKKQPTRRSFIDFRMPTTDTNVAADTNVATAATIELTPPKCEAQELTPPKTDPTKNIMDKINKFFASPS